MTAVVVAAPPHVASGDNKLNRAAWPPMKQHDIWNDDLQEFNSSQQHKGADDYEIYGDEPTQLGNFMEAANDESIQLPRDSDWHRYTLMHVNYTNTTVYPNLKRQKKVIHLFPVPVDGECLSNDGRRTGTCFNAYECRSKGGQATGECAHGFGVCCIYIASCNETISNNITYLVSPSFPSFMPNNVSNCKLKIKLMNDDISQLRLDFYHFILGQPNRRTGVCDGDVFNITGGPGGTFSMCGQNSGQHVYYDVGGRMVPRQTLYGSLRPLRYEDLYPGRNATGQAGMEIEINLSFAQRFLPTRLWEIRIAQIPFSQRAPAGCLQYFTGTEGVFQTFNFADNGRHLANQNYRICMRQEMEMCSIVYQPCDEQSFRIGPGPPTRIMNLPSNIGANNGMGGGGGGVPMGDIMNMQMMISPIMDQLQMQVLADDGGGAMPMSMTPTAATVPSTEMTSTTTVATSTASPSTTAAAVMSSDMTSTNAASTVSTSATTEATTSTSAAPAADDPDENSPTMPSTTATTLTSTSTTIRSTTMSTTTSTTQSSLDDDIEGSGGDEDGGTRFGSTPLNVSRRPRPTRGGFDLLGFLRTAFEMRFRKARQGRQMSDREKRQFFSSCRDRITMPCIVEDFIGTGLGPLPGCEPVHCGMQFCSNGMWPCRIESTVTPFYVGIHFGDGNGKGSAEDNIGACLRYQQMQCL
uniref:CUB domain-containing protein n=1 Tax=Stomoxys calcitrans TaxID=35570 RepID=A0A1I8PE50_STOCA